MPAIFGASYRSKVPLPRDSITDIDADPGGLVAHPDYAQFRPPPEPLDRPVWIDLAQLYGPPQPSPSPPRTGSIRDQMRQSLDLGRRVPGMLRWWVRSVDGRWLGLCDFTIPDTGGATVIRQEGVAVPADALEPRPEERRR